MTSCDKPGNFQETYSNTMNNQFQQQTNVPMQSVNYGYDQPGDPAQVQVQIQQQPTVTYEKSFSWCHFIMNTIIFICSCSNPASMVFTILGMVFSANAYSSHGDKQFERARRQNFVAMIFWIISLIFTIISVIILIIVVSVIASAASSAVDTLQSTADNWNTNNNNNFGN